ncbi:BirA family transcriptional regulator, biotin operon repressor / biotin-[acetyl-CoA-carboxylase] ligase [Salinibacillus kushneri]|uniref:Bifunctional ligase/repressor BirA n=2 Tax=Salinibacillus kushneri TaxID=237682 RepID=A0A1I0I298_9BACI|nr:BirA family transcriptional regulator, biotin operon repressor / biotin-[acetyl-CoA-carboxylase] ligase [Salinibacillus kushneri]
MESTRKKLITLLADAKDSFISGQRLSDELSISRAAIWKHMKALEQEGYEIEAVSRKGYRIVSFPEEMSVNTIQWDLRTVWLGQKMYYRNQVDSTQSIAHQLARDGAVHGTVVVADEQVKGRGRLHRPWHSQKGKGIWMSIILRPNIEPQRAPQLTLASAVAITRMLKSVCHVDAKIKWPNDIFLHNRKLAGILTEMQAEQDLIEYVIIGMGINVNQNQTDIPDSLTEIATSLKLETGETFKRETLIQSILKELEVIYDQYIQQGFSAVKSHWEEAAYRMGETITVKTRNQKWDALLVGIQDDGALIVEDQTQNRRVLYSAEIDWKRGKEE